MTQPDRTELSDLHVQAARRQLERVVLGDTRLPRRATPVKVAMTVGAVCAIGVAAATIPNYSTISDPTYVECRVTLDPDEFGNGLAVLEPFDPKSGHDSLSSITDPVGACRVEWEQGRMSNSTIAGSSMSETGENPAPSLVLCVAKDGHAVVVPSSDPAVCAELALAQPNPVFQTTAVSN